MEKRKADIKEITEFIKLIKQLDESKQKGLYLIIKGAGIMTGKKDELLG